MSSPSWKSIPWSPISGAVEAPSKSTPIGWHKQSVPYASDGTYLQTLDIWIPARSDSDTQAPPDAAAPLPSQPGPWIVYIHGGAWRDPTVTASSFGHTASLILQSLSVASNDSIPLAGIASLNYRLSPHPTHPTDPAPARDATAPVDVARTARHPEHICDVLTALSYLQSLGASSDYILAGHSCGATLAFQAAMDSSRWGQEAGSSPIKKPLVLVGLNGLYDVPAFIKQPDDSHKSLVPVYEAFTRGAFGDDEETWAAVQPVVVEDWKTEWPEGRRIVLVQSHEDNLVPYSQLEIMRRQLEKSAGADIKVEELPATRDHHELWRHGEELAGIFVEVVRRVVEA